MMNHQFKLNPLFYTGISLVLLFIIPLWPSLDLIKTKIVNSNLELIIFFLIPIFLCFISTILIFVMRHTPLYSYLSNPTRISWFRFFITAVIFNLIFIRLLAPHIGIHEFNPLIFNPNLNINYLFLPLFIIELARSLTIDKIEVTKSTKTNIFFVVNGMLILLFMIFGHNLHGSSLPLTSQVKELIQPFLLILISITICTLIINIDTKTIHPRLQSHSLLWLAVIIVMYTIFRLPYFNSSFGVAFHSDKYTSYVPFAEKMAENVNPFIYSNPSFTTIYEDVQEHKFSRYWRLPILEWSMAPLLLLKSYFPTEVLVRASLTIWGSILLTTIFLILRQIFDSQSAFIGTVVLSITPLFNLLTWVTVLDLPAITLLFFALLLYLKGKNNYAYTILGLAILAKISIAIIAYPLFLILISNNLKLHKQLNLGRLIMDCLELFILSLLPFLYFQGILRDIPSNPENIFLHLMKLSVYILMIMISTKYVPKVIFSLRNTVGNNVNRILVLSLLGFIIGFFVFHKPLIDLSSNFLTDTNLLLQFDFYKLLLERIERMSGGWVTGILILSIFFIVTTKRGIKGLPIIASLFGGSIIYFVVASKSIRFALYYNHIFTILFIFCITAMFHILVTRTRLMKFQKAVIVGVMLTLVTIYFTKFEESIFKGNREMQNIKQVAHYIETTTSPNEKVLRLTSKLNTLYLYSNRPMILLSGIPTGSEYLTKLRKDISTIGFYQTMQNNNIRFLVSYNYEMDLSRILYIFTEQTDSNAYDRSLLIANDLNESIPLSFTDEFYHHVNPEQYFQLEREFGNIHIYRIVEQKPNV